MTHLSELYEPHHGTLIIAGGTIPKKAAACALRYLAEGIDPIDFFYIGAGAGQQAMKAMTIFSYEIERSSFNAVITFRPIRCKTLLSPDKDHGKGDPALERDATVWRTYIVQHDTEKAATTEPTEKTT